MNSPNANNPNSIRRSWDFSYAMAKLSPSDRVLFQDWWDQFEKSPPDTQAVMLNRLREFLKNTAR